MSHGTFVWNELMTRDVEAAKSFYGSVLGWSFRAMPMVDGTYWIAEMNGESVAGLRTMPPGLPPEVLPHWCEYLQVDDVDARLRLIVEHGGRILRPAFDVPEVGRLGFAVDSGGATLGLMTPPKKD